MCGLWLLFNINCLSIPKLGAIFDFPPLCSLINVNKAYDSLSDHLIKGIWFCLTWGGSNGNTTLTSPHILLINCTPHVVSLQFSVVVTAIWQNIICVYHTDHNMKHCVTICLTYITQYYQLHRIAYIHIWVNWLDCDDVLHMIINVSNMLFCC